MQRKDQGTLPHEISVDTGTTSFGGKYLSGSLDPSMGEYKVHFIEIPHVLCFVPFCLLSTRQAAHDTKRTLH